MNQNLDLLRQDFSRPAFTHGKADHDFFPLEKECEQGKNLLNRAPQKVFHVQEFNPEGLYQSYRDSATGLELPIYAVFDLEGKPLPNWCKNPGGNFS
jgi:hypothetical protein